LTEGLRRLIQAVAGRGAMPVNVLVVQDEAQTASLIRRGLEAEGFAVTIAGDGADGLRLVSSYEFDLVILDLLLPSVSGEEVLARMRQGSSNVRSSS
jgi:DNA-binding response OmpR family regulator